MKKHGVFIDRESMIRIIENGIEVEKVSLQASLLTGNKTEATAIRHRIADAQIASLIISGDLSSEQSKIAWL